MKLFNSCIYSGFVTHRRFKPKRHFFSYKTFSLLIDLNELKNLEKNIYVEIKSTSTELIDVINNTGKLEEETEIKLKSIIENFKKKNKK